MNLLNLVWAALETKWLSKSPCLDIIPYVPGGKSRVFHIFIVLIQFFTSRIDNNSLAVSFVVHVIGILDVLFILHYFAGGTD